jgi:hypothetical protein
MTLTAGLNQNRSALKPPSSLTSFVLKKKQKEFSEHDGAVDKSK